VLAQMGSTIAIGLLIDTFIVRSLLMPSIAVLLGRWFWWPQVVHPRGRYNTEKFVPKAFQQPARQEPVSAGAAGRSGFVDDTPTDSYPTSTA